MRRMLLGAVSAALLPLVAVGTNGGPASAASAPDVKRVERAFGDGAVRLRPRQGVDVTFRARKGDQVFLDIVNERFHKSPCFGTQSVRDGRGVRRSSVDGIRSAKVVTIRTTGRVVLGFRGYCAANERQRANRAVVQLTKVRMREVAREDRTTVRAPRRGFVDIAYVRVRQHGRDTLSLRADDGTIQTVRKGRVLRGSRLSYREDTASASVEAGHRAALNGSTYGAAVRLRAGERVGLVVPARGYAESLRARVHHTSLDGPVVTLQADPGREDVLVYAATAYDRPYVTGHGDLGDPTWYPWRTYSGGADRRDETVRRTIFASNPNGDGPQQLRVRMRRTVRVTDLVVGGPSVTFSSPEPGTRFVASIPATDAGTVRLSATDVSVTGPWGSNVPPTVCNRDCLYTGLSVNADTPVVDGTLQPDRVHELQLFFGADASGSVTLALTDRP